MSIELPASFDLRMSSFAGVPPGTILRSLPIHRDAPATIP
jgi:hypothetical protein